MKIRRLYGKLWYLLIIPAVITGCSDYAEDSVFEDFKRHVERKNGMTCQKVHQHAIDFVEKEIRPIIVAGRNGEDWLAISKKEISKEFRIYEEKTFQCHLVQGNAERIGKKMEGDFDTLQQLFSVLAIFSRSYNGEQPSAKDLKPGAFEKVDSLYRNLTNQPSGQ